MVGDVEWWDGGVKGNVLVWPFPHAVHTQPTHVMDLIDGLHDEAI